MPRLVPALICVLLSVSALAQTPVSDLAKPPADARHFIIESPGGKHGDSWSWVAADGTRMARESMNLRGQVWEMDYRGAPDAKGMPQNIVIRGATPQGDAAEDFMTADGKARWKSPVDAGEAAAGAGFYATYGGPMDTSAWFVDQLLAQPDKTLALLPGGKAKATQLTTAEVGSAATRQTITLWSITGVGTSPWPVWSDAKGKFFGSTNGIAWLPEAYAGERVHLETVQGKAMATLAPALVRTLLKAPAGPVAFTNVRLFDADGLRFLEGQTVVVSKGLITAIGPASRVQPPKGAILIDGKGKTLVPGLWDCHMHVGDDFTGPQELSLGVTSARDPGNNDALTIDRRTRRAAGQLLSPNVYASALIDGKGPYTAQVANVANSQAEAIDIARKTKAKGFVGLKFYGTFNSDWLAPTIAEAHRLGLHVHGHIPRGIRPMDAIRAGYDEITHINWIVMQAMPDSVIQVSNGIARFEGPGRYAKDADLDGPALSDIVSAMASKKIYSDPTMVAFEGLYVPENGELSDSYAPFVGTLPPSSERGFKSGGFAVPKDLTRADYRASWAKMVALLGKMHKAGVPIVAGTDGSGIEIVHELEIYGQAGFSPAEALAAATIVPARLVGQEKKTGSIAIGKVADLVLVEGDPSTRIGDLRHTRMVMLGGKLMDADALRAAAGFSGRPK
jgi:imidazolonepropionase-like amidohydrolase